MFLSLWQKLSRVPFGRRFFNLALMVRVPYSGSVFPEVIEMEKGKVRVRMKDQKRVRNHLNSIHAIALANLGELSSGLAVTSTLPKNLRAIIVKIEIDYIKKARGTLIANSTFSENLEGLRENKNFIVEAFIEDKNQDVVAKVTAHWRVGPEKKF